MRAFEIAGYLLERAAVKVKVDPPFTWASGIKSPVYCDNRMMIAFPKERKRITESFVEMMNEKGIKPDVIAGTATAAIPWAAFLAYELNLPMIYVRPEKKDHGAGKMIEGSLEPRQHVLLIEDLISTGGSSIKAVEAIREEGDAIVDDVFAIVSWELPNALPAFEAAGVNLHTVTDYSHLIRKAKDEGVISSDLLEVVLEFKDDPQNWGKKMGF